MGKAKLAKDNRGRIECLYAKEKIPKKKSKGFIKAKRIKLNRAGNPMTIGLDKCINLLVEKKILCKVLKANILALMEIRDNAIHFCYDDDTVCLKINEFGTASLKNYFNCIKEWFNKDLSEYNIFLMPITFKHKFEFESYSINDNDKQTENFLKYIANIENHLPFTENTMYNVSLKLNLKYTKATSSSSILVSNSKDPNAIKVRLTEEEITEKYPFAFKDIYNKCTSRYSNFIKNEKFWKILKLIKQNEKSAYKRKLNPKNKKSLEQYFYNGNVFQVLDKYYLKKQ